MKSRVDVIIPSYNGKHLLSQNLPHIIKNTSNLGKITIIDNGSTDDTVAWLSEKYPEIQVVINDTNLGYTRPVNQGIAVSHADYFVLINNDVRPEKDYLKNTRKYFDDPKVFAVSFNEKDSSWPKISWSQGKMQFSRGEDKTKPYFSAWASGGSALFRRSIWDKLGGLDEVFAPWYWEDIDIGYRAWKSGYKIIWEPKSLVVHDHESTTKKLDQNYVNLIKQRNELLFNWLNIKDISFKMSHLVFLVSHTFKHPGYLKIIFSALWRLITHGHVVRSFIVSDKKALLQFSKPYEN